MLALAHALDARGHSACLLGPPDFVDEAAHFGVEYRSYGRSMEAFLAENSRVLGDDVIKLARAACRFMDDELLLQFEHTRRAAREGVDVVLGAGMMFAAASVADAEKLPYRYVAYTPDAIPSRFHAPMTCPYRGLSPWLNRILWRIFSAVNVALLRKPINQHRAALGLPAIEDVTGYLFPRERMLLAADPTIGPWPADATDATPPTGAWLLSDGRGLGAELEAFLEAGEPPVYVGFGSMADSDPSRTTAIIADAVGRVGCRAVLAAGWAKLGGADLGPRIRVIGSVPHAALFPRVAAVVHHGGAGTSHAAARAGVPQIVVPHLLDQFGWAARLHERGLAPPPFRRSQLRADRLAASIRACLTDEAMRARATRVRTESRAFDGLATTIALLEGLVPSKSARPKALHASSHGAGAPRAA
jgi:UDP:flavonoid glycosyltransferase YjiC (YdhE family)